jgi:hypothetical protein
MHDPNRLLTRFTAPTTLLLTTLLLNPELIVRGSSAVERLAIVSGIESRQLAAAPEAQSGKRQATSQRRQHHDQSRQPNGRQ